MADIIDYNDNIIIETLKQEVIRKAGARIWETLINGINIPDENNECKYGCSNMFELMNRFDELIDEETGKSILTNVRHGLKRSQFISERERFKQYNNIDKFIKADYENEVKRFEKLCENKEDFYGQPITKDVLDFVINQPGMLATIRKDNELHITAFPSEMVKYLNETDERKKRYYACHCPFAKESILSDNGVVSKTICNCSLGHCKVRWDTIFDRDLDGKVLQSVLDGDLLCKYVIYLPDDIMEKYVDK